MHFFCHRCKFPQIRPEAFNTLSITKAKASDISGVVLNLYTRESNTITGYYTVLIKPGKQIHVHMHETQGPRIGIRPILLTDCLPKQPIIHQAVS